MTKINFLLLLIIVKSIIAMESFAIPTVQGGIFNQGSTLIIKAKSNQAITTGFMSASVVTIKYLISYNVTFGTPVSSYGLVLITTLDSGGYRYNIFGTASGTFNFNWAANTEYEIMRVTLFGGSGTGTFYIGNDTYTINHNGEFYIEHNVFGDITNHTTPLYQPVVYNVPLPVIAITHDVPDKFELGNNYPNPFNPITTILYQIPKTTHVLIEVYNSLGQIAEQLINEDQSTGYYQIVWNAIDKPSGIYYYRIITKDFVDTKKMVLAK